MIDDKEVKYRCNEVAKTMETLGWKFIESELSLERNKLLEVGKKAYREGKRDVAADTMAALDGFDNVLNVMGAFKAKYEMLIESEKRKREVFENA